MGSNCNTCTDKDGPEYWSSNFKNKKIEPK